MIHKPTLAVYSECFSGCVQGVWSGVVGCDLGVNSVTWLDVLFQWVCSQDVFRGCVHGLHVNAVMSVEID